MLFLYAVLRREGRIFSEEVEWHSNSRFLGADWLSDSSDIPDEDFALECWYAAGLNDSIPDSPPFENDGSEMTVSLPPQTIEWARKRNPNAIRKPFAEGNPPALPGGTTTKSAACDGSRSDVNSARFPAFQTFFGIKITGSLCGVSD